MTIGIIGAMVEEVESLKKEMREIKIIKEKLYTFYCGIINNKKIILTICGIGKVNSAVLTTILIKRFCVNKIIFTGVAGAINSDLNIGDVVISDDLMYHDFDTTCFSKSYNYGEIPRMKTSIFKANNELINLAKTVGEKILINQKIKIGRIVSGDQFVSSKDKIKWIEKNFNALCVEMEGASVAHVAHIFNIDFVILRAISDKADHSAKIDYEKFIKMAAKNSKEIVFSMLNEL